MQELGGLLHRKQATGNGEQGWFAVARRLHGRCMERRAESSDGMQRAISTSP
jgi:hypothetical protein